MATKRVLQQVTFVDQDGGEVLVAAPAAENALLAFEVAMDNHGFIKIYDGTMWRYLNLGCICSVLIGDYVEETIDPIPCEDVNCIPDYEG